MHEPQPDQPAHRFFHRIAQHLVELPQPKLGDIVLKVAAGLGAVPLYAAAKVEPMGKVIAQN